MSGGAPLSWSSPLETPLSVPGASWQGIEYLSLTLDPPGSSPRGADLIVQLYQPTTDLAPDDIVVTGGRRIANLDYVVTLGPGAIPIGPRAGETLTATQAHVRFRFFGDRSDYYVALQDGGAFALHPFFALQSFTFAVNCEAGDCRPSIEEAEQVAELPPVVDLLTKDYTGFVQLLAERVRVQNPDWADLSPASFERALLELLAHHGDMLSYYQDRVANEAFVSTASQRYSLWQHGLLLGYELFDGRAAKTLLAFDVSNSGWVPSGLEVQMEARADEATVVFAVADRTRVEKTNSSEHLEVAAWPAAHNASIARGATEMLLWKQDNALAAGMQLAFVQGSFSQVVTLTEVDTVDLPGWTHDPGDPLTVAPQPLTRIRWREPLERALFPWEHDPPIADPDERARQALRIHGNLAPARHGAARTAWLNPLDETKVRRRHVRVSLTRHNSIVERRPRGSVEVHMLRALRAPEGPVAFAAPRGDGASGPDVEVEIAGHPWLRAEHLHSSRSYDTHFAASTDNDGSLWLHFGDGVHGHEVEIDPDTGEPIAEVILRYRVGEPLAGNIARDKLVRVRPPEDAGSDAGKDWLALGATTVTNVIAGAGGHPRETLGAARLSIPASLRHGRQLRAVSLQDYASAAEQVEGVARAVARRTRNVFDTILVLVDPEGQEELDADLANAVFEHLDRLRMTGREHRIAQPVYVPLDVELWLCAEPGWQRHDVRRRVLAALHPGSDERPGYFHPDRLTFSETMERGEVLAFVQRIPGVRSVKAHRFRRLLDSSPELSFARLELEPIEIVRLDADPGYPDNGRLTVKIVGLDDDIDIAAFDIEASGGAP